MLLEMTESRETDLTDLPVIRTSESLKADVHRDRAVTVIIVITATESLSSTETETVTAEETADAMAEETVVVTEEDSATEIRTVTDATSSTATTEISEIRIQTIEIQSAI